MSLSFYQIEKLMSIPAKQETQIEMLKMAIKKQDRMIALLERIVAAQQERKTGRWERKMDGVFCSNCHKGWDFIRGVPAEVETEYKFCPRCGKRMEVDT